MVAVLLVGLLVLFAMTTLATAPVVPAAIALLSVYVLGYVAGALLVDARSEDATLSLAVIRTVSGLLLSTIAFLLSLVLALPWFVLPCMVVAAAITFRRRAWALPAVSIRPHTDDVVAALLAGTVVSPILISLYYMAPGDFPPVFYNIDTAYFMEKVHGLVSADLYPPESLSNVGIRRTYHYGTQAMAALLTRASGLPAHQSAFLVVMPLLTLGVLAAATAAARYIAPSIPRAVSVPVLLMSTPSLSSSFWAQYGPEVRAMITEGVSLDRVVGNIGIWGMLSNEGQNVGGDFVILASIAGMAASSVWGWRMTAFLVGSGILVKTPVGIALMAGFGLSEAWRALRARSLRPSSQALATAAVFAVTYGAFFVVKFESNFHVEPAWLFHVLHVQGEGRLPGMMADLLWLLLPAAIVASAGVTDPERQSMPLMIMGTAPLVLVNVTRMDNIGIGGGGTGNDWFQIVHAVPFLLHAFALSLASRRWRRLGRARRTAFLAAMVIAVAPLLVAASRYAVPFLGDPEQGNEYVDNRPLAEALATIPTRGTILVTNDLRYPAGHFTRDYRQMQFPALFGHQAFAVNYAHEAVEERRPLQVLLQQTTWSDAILAAAREHRWTHFVVRKDYAHPAPIPLTQIFDSPTYAVFVFP